MPQHVDAVSFGDDGISEGVEDGAIVIDCTSNSLDMVRSLHERYADQGITFLDTPVSGGVVSARMERDLAVYVGGDQTRTNPSNLLSTLWGTRSSTAEVSALARSANR